MDNGNEKLGSALAAATCALLGTTAVAPVEAQEAGRWDFDTALMFYGESDNRVSDLSASVLAKRDFDDDRFLTLDLSFDTLTGASPSGATAMGRAQTFTSPSGKGIYTTAAGDIPLDDAFRDSRVALGATWTQPLARLYTFSGGIGLSNEYDYRHIGANASLARDFNQRNTTLSAGLAFSRDENNPVGGTPAPLSLMGDVGDLSNRIVDGSKDIVDLLVGVTQVINKTTLVRINYSHSISDGYLTDPYKLLSVVDPLTGDTVLRIPAAGNGPTGQYRFESRPDSRTKQALYAQLKKYFGGKVLDVSFRYMTDDWGIDSQTLDGQLHWPVGTSSYLEPHVRYYTQGAADFYRTSLVAGQALPQFASADSRLGEFDGVTVGLKYGHKMGSGNEWSMRLEYYQQSGTVADSALIGNQRQFDQFPDLTAVIAQFGYRFGR